MSESSSEMQSGSAVQTGNSDADLEQVGRVRAAGDLADAEAEIERLKALGYVDEPGAGRPPPAP